MKTIRWSALLPILILVLFPLVVASDYYRHILIIASCGW